MNAYAFWLTQVLNALSQASLLFTIAVGLTLIFGIMRVVNFAHGALYMLGAYVGATIVQWTGSFFLALLIAPPVVALFGAAFDRLVLCRLYGRGHGAHLQVTFGLALVLGEVVRLTWGPDAREVPLPAYLSDVVWLLDEPFPVYRLVMIAIGLAVALGLWLVLERTRIGLLIRATSQNPEMVHALGNNIAAIRTGVFALGCGMAALGGVMASPLLTAFLAMAPAVVVDAFVIVIIGGMGSFIGSAIGSLLVGFVQVFGNFYFPELALVFMYALMALVLVFRPGGLLGKEM